MIFYKTLEPTDILNSLANLIGKNLPKELTEADYSISLEFCDDHSIEIYLVPPEKGSRSDKN